MINIIKALYGRKSSTICTKGNYRMTNCGDELESLTKVKSLCEGEKTCTLTAGNSFGDLCHGVSKYLDVTYRCESK